MAQTDGLWRRYKEKGDIEARERLILAYAHLAKYVVDRMHLRPSAAMGCEDLVGHAVVGLIDAVQRFDPARDVKFETYALPRIRGAVLDAIRGQDWIPRSVRSSEQELRRALAELEGRLGRPPTDAETAEMMGVGIDRLHEVLADVGQAAMLSLEELMLYGEEGGGQDILSSAPDSASDPILAAELEERKQLLADAVGRLPERERLVISLYYKEGLTFKEIAQVLGVTESRACQLHSKAVVRLHGKLARHADLMLAAA
jgi:RNA polymerase sigma factor for flagellar operon FliA